MTGVQTCALPISEPMPLQINKWKLNTSLEAKLNNRAVALRNPRERATFLSLIHICSYMSRNSVPEYRYINYDLELVKNEYELVSKSIMEMQMEMCIRDRHKRGG